MRRRTFVAALAGAAAAPMRAAPVRPRRKLQEFDYGQVTLTGGPLAGQYGRLRAHYLGLENDRLLKVYRQRAGLPATGADMGGWYDADGFVPGHLLGQLISGLARLHAATGDLAAAAKVRALVDGYAATLGPADYPFAGAKASTTWPCYILDKYTAGLIDAATLGGCAEARALLPRVIRGALPYIPDHVYDRGPNSPKQAPYDEPYILPENLFRAHELTGDATYLRMARTYLLDADLFDPLAADRNILPGKHAYSHVIALSSGAKAYEVLGHPKYLAALRNAWDMLEQTQEFASGAWGPKEAFVRPHEGELGASLAATHDHFETPCGYYAHSKLARYLLGFTGEARYADGLERVLLNTVLGALDPDDDGGYFYYSDYHARAKKGYYKRKWPCCAGTLLQSVADYPLNLYFADGDSLHLAVYADSELRWEVNGIPVKVAQRTAYPASERIELRIEPEAPVEFGVHPRIPGWLDRPARIAVNGKPVPARPVRRRWRRGDTLEIALPFSFRAVPIDDRNPNTVALMRGPVMLAAVDAPEDLALDPGRLRETGRPLEFALGSTVFKPFYSIRDEAYSTYFPLRG